MKEWVGVVMQGRCVRYGVVRCIYYVTFWAEEKLALPLGGFSTFIVGRVGLGRARRICEMVSISGRA